MDPQVVLFQSKCVKTHRFIGCTVNANAEASIYGGISSVDQNVRSVALALVRILRQTFDQCEGTGPNLSFGEIPTFPPLQEERLIAGIP